MHSISPRRRFAPRRFIDSRLITLRGLFRNPARTIARFERVRTGPEDGSGSYKLGVEFEAPESGFWGDDYSLKPIQIADANDKKRISGSRPLLALILNGFGGGIPNKE
jgi:hypothetical protein